MSSNSVLFLQRVWFVIFRGKDDFIFRVLHHRPGISQVCKLQKHSLLAKLHETHAHGRPANRVFLNLLVQLDARAFDGFVQKRREPGRFRHRRVRFIPRVLSIFHHGPKDIVQARQKQSRTPRSRLFPAVRIEQKKAPVAHAVYFCQVTIRVVFVLPARNHRDGVLELPANFGRHHVRRLREVTASDHVRFRRHNSLSFFLPRGGAGGGIIGVETKRRKKCDSFIFFFFFFFFFFFVFP